MSFSAAAFNSMLGRIGQEVAWRRATQCPCRNPFSGAPAPSCPVCGGYGFSWGDVTWATTALSGMSSRRRYEAAGRWEEGDVVITVPSSSPLYAIGENDRVQFVQSSEPFSVVVLPDDEDTILFLVQYCERVCWIAGGVLADGDPPQVDPSGKVYWTQDQLRPPAGVSYTLSGRRAPEYFCLPDLGQDRAHSMGQPLPRRVQLRKFSSMRGSGVPGSISPPGE